MADRRMLTKKVTDDDNFMSLSSSAQALYLHLSMSADDDGFSNQISLSMFKAHASVQDLEALLDKRYIYQFENGVIVIKHWRMANALRKDRYTPTAFQEELAKLQLKENGSYTWLPNGCQVVAERLPQNSIDKNSIGKDSINKTPYGEFANVMLTPDEYEKIKDKGLLDILEELSGYIEQIGTKAAEKKYKSHYAVILNWARRKPKETKQGNLKSKPTYDINDIEARSIRGDDITKLLEELG